ncbi:helix-turn-helix domain-containing protein [Tomitella gaofuii]|uniref:helix-turn-helix domain-containing protein n=1 Tax=Tomitella gaofuii TaxID=2760083 RepID=UPI0015FAC6EC|nr:helix-turn-helix transcriptional regulator [Tomitella gaofuii]
MAEGDKRRPTLGELIRTQREMASLPMRRLAEMVGISNPYLSQIERNLRAPSDKVLEAIAENLKLSSELLFSTARPSDPEGQPEVVAAIRRDPDLTHAQRATLEEMYSTFRHVTVENRRRGRGTGRDAGDVGFPAKTATARDGAASGDD